ncbi:MAG: 2-oxoacid:acceptor oxidoreductase family protein [Thermoleophilia bacterium]|nr:2-oxoacid:acceptor oxidoreductase family protein [Thermoleophilia bacterium]
MGADGNGGGRLEVRLAGQGGQGIVLAGVILAEAAIRAGKNATQSQAYGPESRGGSARADVVIADGEIGFPQAQELDVLLALTQEACEKYARDLRPTGLLVIDERSVPEPPAGVWRVCALPIGETAERAGSLMTANVVALGAVAALTGIVDAETMERAVAARVPRQRELNLRALEAGRRLVASES